MNLEYLVTNEHRTQFKGANDNPQNLRQNIKRY